MSDRLRGKTAFITGASRGIGRAIADAYAAAGASLVLNARDDARLAAAAEEIAKDYGVAVRTAAGDLTDREGVRALVERTLEAGPVDVLVNNAGVHKARSFLDYSFEEFREIVETNVYGVLHVTQFLLPGMIARKQGRIINLASTAGKWGSRNQSAYNASKHAVVGLTRCLALEMAPHNVLVNAICPWIVDTDMATGFIREHAVANGLAPEAMLEAFKAAVPIKRMIKPEEIAALAVFLASDEAAYVNGQSWAVDGGYTMI